MKKEPIDKNEVEMGELEHLMGDMDKLAFDDVAKRHPKMGGFSVTVEQMGAPAPAEDEEEGDELDQRFKQIASKKGK